MKVTIAWILFLCWTAALVLALKYQIVVLKLKNIFSHHILTGAASKREVYLFFGILYGFGAATLLTFNVLLIMDVSRGMV